MPAGTPCQSNNPPWTRKRFAIKYVISPASVSLVLSACLRRLPVCLSVCLPVGCAALEIALAKRRRCGGGFRSLPSQPTDRPTDRQGEGINQSRYELPLHSKPSLSFFRWFGFGWEEGGEGGIDLVTALVKKSCSFFLSLAPNRALIRTISRENLGRSKFSEN